MELHSLLLYQYVLVFCDITWIPADIVKTIAKALNGTAIEAFWSGTSFLLSSTGAK